MTEMLDTDSKFICDGLHCSHGDLEDNGELIFPLDAILEMLVSEVSFLSGILEPSIESKKEDVKSLQAVLVRFTTGDGKDSTLLIDISVAMELAKRLLEWSIPILKNDADGKEKEVEV